MDAAVRQISVPDDALACSALPRVDYADAFLLETGDGPGRTAEGWARAILEDAPAAVRASLLTGWSSLGLRLNLGRSVDTVLAWPIRTAAPDLLVLAAGSRIGMPAELLVRRRAGAALFCTFVHFGNPAVRALWAGVEPVHVPIVRRLLEGAAAA
jgi:hypothetical protein